MTAHTLPIDRQRTEAIQGAVDQAIGSINTYGDLANVLAALAVVSASILSIHATDEASGETAAEAFGQRVVDLFRRWRTAHPEPFVQIRRTVQ